MRRSAIPRLSKKACFSELLKSNQLRGSFSDLPLTMGEHGSTLSLSTWGDIATETVSIIKD